MGGQDCVAGACKPAQSAGAESALKGIGDSNGPKLPSFGLKELKDSA